MTDLVDSDECLVKQDQLPPLRKRKLQSIDLQAFLDMSKLKHYNIIEKLGQGTFGVVQKAINRTTGDKVALKQLINHSAKEGFPITAMREITILKQLHHKNILKITEMIHEDPKVSNSADLVTHRGCFYTVSPYMSSDLVGLLENPSIKLELPHIKCFMKQLLHGIQYIHEQKFLHRDIKAANILIDSNGVLKIADFGLARSYHGQIPKFGEGPGGGERSYTGLVVTRWYRPPELLLGERKYTTAVDLWGIGCVFAELFTSKPILVGKSDAHQAQLVFGLVGPPTGWMQASLLPNKTDFNIGLTCKRTLESRFQDTIPPDGIELLSGLLTLDPYKRLNALDALNYEFFKNDPLPTLPEKLPKFEESHEIDKERFKKLKDMSNGDQLRGYQSRQPPVRQPPPKRQPPRNPPSSVHSRPGVPSSQPPTSVQSIRQGTGQASQNSRPNHLPPAPRNENHYTPNQRPYTSSFSSTPPNSNSNNYSDSRRQPEDYKEGLSTVESIRERLASSRLSSGAANSHSLPRKPNMYLERTAISYKEPVLVIPKPNRASTDEPSGANIGSGTASRSRYSTLASTAGIFVGQKRAMATMPLASKKQKLMRPDEIESELSEVEGDLVKEDEQSLSKFLQDKESI